MCEITPIRLTFTAYTIIFKIAALQFFCKSYNFTSHWMDIFYETTKYKEMKANDAEYLHVPSMYLLMKQQNLSK